MSRSLFFVVAITGALTAGAIIWKMTTTNRLAYQVTPTPVVLPAETSSEDLMQVLGTTVDDGGENDMSQLDQEVSQLD